MATHSSILVWRIPQTKEAGGRQSSVSTSQTWLRRLSMHAYALQAGASGFCFTHGLLWFVHTKVQTFLGVVDSF